MAWLNVELAYGKSTYTAMQRGAEIVAPLSIGSPKTIKVNGTAYNVIAAEQDMRGEYMSLWIDCEIEEPADAEPEEEMSDDEPESKRKSHNVLERKRRNDLKMSYQALRVEVPAVATNERAPPGHILIESWKYIEQLKKEEQELVAAIAVERLRKQQLSQLLY